MLFMCSSASITLHLQKENSSGVLTNIGTEQQPHFHPLKYWQSSGPYV